MRTIPVGTFITVVSLAGALVSAGCSTPANQPASSSSAQTSAPAPWGPPVSINAEMVALVDHAGHALWETEREGQAPKTDEDWALLEEHAIQLAAAGRLIARPGTGVNDVTLTGAPDWQKWSHRLSDAGLAARKAVEAKDLKALVVANGQLVETCEGCHKQFKPALRSEGIMHRHTH